jgi:hypothetical protein
VYQYQQVKVTNSATGKAVLKAPLGLPSESPDQAPKQRCAVASGAWGQCLLVDRDRRTPRAV